MTDVSDGHRSVKERLTETEKCTAVAEIVNTSFAVVQAVYFGAMVLTQLTLDFFRPLTVVQTFSDKNSQPRASASKWPCIFSPQEKKATKCCS